MRIEPTENKEWWQARQTFNGKNTIIECIKPTSYGKCIHGKSARGLDYDVYVSTDKSTGNVEHKLYCVFKDNKWVKSFLRYFSENKLSKELRSQTK